MDDPNISTAYSEPNSNAVGIDPRAEYTRRLEHRRQQAHQAERRDERVALLRGVLFVIFLIFGYQIFRIETLSFWLLAPVVALYAVTMALHARVIRDLDLARRAVRYYERGIARIEHRWADFGSTGERYVDPHHLYSSDLDIFGPGSLFQLISTARTRLGEDQLAAWLSMPADPETIRQRQQAAQELRDQVDLREQIALLSADVHDDLDQNQLLHWSAEPAQPISRGVRLLAVLLALASITTLCGWLLGHLRLSNFLIVATVQLLFLASLRPHLRSLSSPLEKAASGLAILAQVLELLERQQFHAPCLTRLHRRLDTGGQAPSAQIARLNRLIRHLDNALRNQFFLPIAGILCLPVHLIHAIEVWRNRFAADIVNWLQSVGEFEAVMAIGGYCFERPGDIFPQIVAEPPCVAGTQLGHPLLPTDQCVRNDLTLDESLHLIMISGSNMSGKSTMLRTVGTNVVLALAGAPVCAKSLTVSPFVVGTSMRVHDSLQDGESLFYSVVSRLKDVVNQTEAELPLLFLLDEILQGTNSHDRRIGAEGIIRQLVDQGALGLVTTHDLALTRIVESFGTLAVNRHFEDRIVAGRMSFDYTMRPGTITRTNALELMRMVGLNVDAPKTDEQPKQD